MDMPVLRNTLTQLRAISFDRSVPANASMAPQEMLDFLAMLAGIKPVYLLGRGFDDPQWVEGLVALARKKRLYLLEGPMWDAGPVSPGAPIWLHDYLNTTQGDGPAFYICRTRANAEAVTEVIRKSPYHHGRGSAPPRVSALLCSRALRTGCAFRARILHALTTSWARRRGRNDASIAGGCGYERRDSRGGGSVHESDLFQPESLHELPDVQPMCRR
jgi:hypothetical protein